jgi:NADPH:quinone reductase-like Zn-dependent oxidoreductase
MAESMRAWRVTGYGPTRERLVLSEIERPVPGPGEVRLRVAACGLNPIDYKLVRGDLRRLEPLPFPATIGFDASGVIDAVGAGVAGLSAGDPVFVRASRATLGAFAEFTVQPARFVARRPATIDAVPAASLPLVALTTVQALEQRAQLRAGQSILILAGSGGLGSYAIQHAKALGATVHTTASARNAEWVAALGADRVLRYDQGESPLADHYDVVFDTLGGAQTRGAFDLIRTGGTVVSVAGPPDREMAAAFSAGPIVRAAMWWLARPVYAAAARRRARYFRFLTESDGAQLAAIAARVDRGEIRPVVDRRFAFEDAIVAFDYLETGHARGKVVLELSGG